MAFTKSFFLAVFAVAVALMLDQARAQCVCTTLFYPLCDRYDRSDVVVRATASARNETGDDAIYTLDIITLYKAEDGGNYTDEISFTTPATYEDCGVTITLGEEYLIGLNGPSDDGVFNVPHCHGVLQLWSSVGTGGLDCGIDPCYGACDVYEECQLYEYDANYYCSEICSDGACDEGETCKTQDEDWCSNSRYIGCPTRRECS